MKNFLLGVIAAGVLVIAGVLVYNTAGMGEKTHTDAWRTAYEDAERGAGYYCTMNGAATTAGDLYSDEYKNCVKDEAAADMEAWERNNPDDVWE